VSAGGLAVAVDIDTDIARMHRLTLRFCDADLKAAFAKGLLTFTA
jgi:hypothetical protein